MGIQLGNRWKRGRKMSNIGNREVFSKNLSYYIEMSGRDQKEIAKVIGVAPSTFNEWVKGKKYPRIDKIEMLANYFGILKSDLIEDTKAKKDISHTIVVTESEQMLLDLFRLVPEDKQQMVLQMIRAALNTK